MAMDDNQTDGDDQYVVYKYRIVMLYTGKLGNIIYQFYLNKKKKRFLTKKL